MVLKLLRILSFVVAIATSVGIANAGVYYIETQSGKIYPFKIKRSIPSKTELQRIQNWLEEQGDSLPYAVPNFDPIECPWIGAPLTCKEYDLSIFDKCIEKRYRSLQGLDRSATVTAKKSINRQCYQKAVDPSIFDKWFN